MKRVSRTAALAFSWNVTAAASRSRAGGGVGAKRLWRSPPRTGAALSRPAGIWRERVGM